MRISFIKVERVVLRRSKIAPG